MIEFNHIEELPRLDFTPLEDRVVLLPVETEKVTAGGIHIPDTAKEKPVRGVVLAAGPGKLIQQGGTFARQPHGLRRGMTVVYPMWAGDKLPQGIGQKDLRILRAGEVLGVEAPQHVDLVEVSS